MRADPNVARKLIVRDVHLGLPPEESRMPVHLVWNMLATHEDRNRQITTDITDALREGRNCAVVSNRKEHLVTLEKLVTETAPNLSDQVHRIDGGMGKKARTRIMDNIDQHAAAGKGFALLATSSLLGEGFDLPGLDTLFLTLPISFKGRMIQYAGRLHRSCAGKSEVRIYDYVEPDHPLTAHMFQKRMTAYRQMGYAVDS